MNIYTIAPEGAGFRVVETLPDASVRVIGRFSNAENAQLWIDDQVRMTGRRDRAPRRFESKVTPWAEKRLYTIGNGTGIFRGARVFRRL
jgi:hypothetical protein